MSEKHVTQLFRLLNLVRAVSYREGDFVLASGKRSSFYIDVKTTSLHPEGASLVGKLAVAKLLEAGYEFGGVGGLTLGADPIATAVSLAALEAGKFWPAFIVRKEPKEHGTGKYVEGADNLKKDLPLLVLEDVVTTGGSSLKAIERLRAEGYQPTVVLTIVDREEGGREALTKAGVEFHALLTLGQVISGRLA